MILEIVNDGDGGGCCGGIGKGEIRKIELSLRSVGMP